MCATARARLVKGYFLMVNYMLHSFFRLKYDRHSPSSVIGLIASGADSDR